MSRRTTFNLDSPATTVPPPSHQETAPAPVDAPVDARQELGRRLSALVLVAAPLAGLAGALLTQDYGGEMSQELDYISAHDTRWLIANGLTLFMGALMAIAIGILMTLARGRAAVLGWLGGTLAIVGIYFHGAVVGYSLVQAPLVASELPRSAVDEFAEQAMYQHPAFLAVLIPFVGFFLGMILLAAALWRARVAPAWVAAMIAAAPLTEFAGIREVSPELMFVLLLIGFGQIASRLMRAQGRVESAATT